LSYWYLKLFRNEMKVCAVIMITDDGITGIDASTNNVAKCLRQEDDTAPADLTTTENELITVELQGTNIADDSSPQLPSPILQPRKRAYSCRKCGKPSKGHVCSAKQSIVSSINAPPQQFDRIGRRRTSTIRTSGIQGPSETDDIDSPSAPKSGNTENCASFNESSLDTNKGSNKVLSGNWLENNVDNKDQYDTTNVRKTVRKRVIQLDSSDDDNTKDDDNLNEKAPMSQSSSKRPYTCRICGVPRKGHICSIAVVPGKRQSPQHQVSTIHTPSKRTKSSKQSGSISKKRLSIMEHKDYGVRSNDEDSDDIPYTEILIPAHFFLDEVQSYIQQQQQHLYADKATPETIRGRGKKVTKLGCQRTNRIYTTQ
jgi:hypothetical protein